MIKKKTKKAFTIVEMLISISILAIIMCLLIPRLLDTYKQSKQDIIDISNKNMTMEVYRDNVLIESGKQLDLSQYEIVDIDYNSSIIIVYVK